MKFRLRFTIVVLTVLSFLLSAASIVLSAYSFIKNFHEKEFQSPAPDSFGNTTSPCNSNSTAWQPSFAGFSAANTSARLSQWWNQTGKDGSRFDVDLGILSNKDSFHCGLDAETQCSTPTCSDIGKGNGGAWIFQVSNSVVNLDSMFEVVYNAITLSQIDATELTSNLADSVFKFKDPVWAGGQIITWVAFAIQVIFTGAAAVLGLGVLAAEGVGILSNAVSQSLIGFLQPQPGLARNTGIDRLDTLFYDISSSTRASLETIVNQTFAGTPDANKKTIVDYIGNGGYANIDILPKQSDAEQFFKSFLFAKSVTSYWQQQNIYAISTTVTPDDSETDWPQEHSWRSAATSRTYVPYTFHSKAQQMPDGLDALNSSLFGINSTSVAESLGRAWEVAGNNYTSAVAEQRLQVAFAHPGNYTPFSDGASWEGVFNITVCDVGARGDWVVAYGGKTLPCCCGAGCVDTADFIQKSNLSQTSDWCKVCSKQIKNDDQLTQDDVDAINSACSAPSSPTGPQGGSSRMVRMSGSVLGISWAFLIVASIVFCL